MAPAFVPYPEGLRVLADGTWTVGGAPVVHGAVLQYLKARLVLEGEAAYVTDSRRRLPVEIAGPPFVALALEVDVAAGQAHVRLDDGSRETLRDESLHVDEHSGRLLCRVRGGQADALLSREAHQTALAHVEQDEGGRFFLRAGLVRYSIRTA